MKMLMIIYNEAIDEEVMAALEVCCVESFTKFRRVLGKGKLSGAHLDSNTWPGANNVLMSVADDGKIPAVLKQVKSLRETLGKEGIKAFVWPVEEAT